VKRERLPGSPEASVLPTATRLAESALLRALLLVGAFWWVATGVIVAVQRDLTTRSIAVAVATVLLLLGIRLVHASQADTSARGARASLLGGALAWAWISTTFYTGWLVGPGPADPAALPGRAPSLELVPEALRAMAHHEVATLAVLVATAVACRSGPNRIGLWALLAFWGTHQLARINIFLGVVNPGTRFLPQDLVWLSQYFGPERNSALLLPSVGALTLMTALLLGASRSGAPLRRNGAAMLAVLIGLAALEHVWLGFSWNNPFWNTFLELRGP
jgi:putative photosynthetic complex assembly protein 2